MSLGRRLLFAVWFAVVASVIFSVYSYLAIVVIAQVSPPEVLKMEDAPSNTDEAVDWLKASQARRARHAVVSNVAFLCAGILSFVTTFLVCVDHLPFGRYRLRLVPKDDSAPEVFS